MINRMSFVAMVGVGGMLQCQRRNGLGSRRSEGRSVAGRGVHVKAGKHDQVGE